MAKYIYLELNSETVNGKPEQLVRNKRSKDILGRICWYPTWKQYVFEAAPNTIWSEDCLNDVRAFILGLPK